MSSADVARRCFEAIAADELPAVWAGHAEPVTGNVAAQLADAATA